MDVLEVELKLAVADVEATRARLVAALGPGRAWTQVDTFFDHPDRDPDTALRLRTETPDDGTARMELTWKGPRREGDAKVRPEHNVGVDDDPTGILQGLGHRASLRITKRRTTWETGDGAHVCLDELDGLGAFVELEVLTASADGATARLQELAQRLGLDVTAHSYTPYVDAALASGAPCVQRLN